MLETFLRYLQYEKRYSVHTLSSYSSDLEQFQKWLTEHYEVELKEASHPMLRGWVVQLVDLGHSATTVNRKISTLKAFYKFLLRREIIDQNPTSRLKVLKRPSRLPKFVKEDDLFRLLDHIRFEESFQGHRDKLIFEMLYGTGMRLSELLGVKISDIDLQKREVKVLGKRNKERIIPLSVSLEKTISEYISALELEFGSLPHPFLLVRDDGQVGYPVLVYRTVKKYLSQFTSLEKRSPHVLRHTFATHLLNKGAELNAVKELLGHSSLAATQVYTHNSLEKIKDAYLQAHPKA